MLRTRRLHRSFTVPALPDWRILLAWLTVTCIWGSTYLAGAISLQSFPALLSTGVRFALGGVLLISILLLRGYSLPTRPRLLQASFTAVLMVAIGAGASISAQYYLASGMTAVLGGTVPIWAAIFLMFMGEHLSKRQWAGVLMGMGGIVLINIDAEFQGEFIGVVLVMLSASAWAFGTLWKRRTGMKGGLMLTACEILIGGLVLTVVGFLAGERLPADPAPEALNAVLYLAIASSVIAYGAYAYLIEHAPPVLTTSYAYTAPLIAVFLGVMTGETLTDQRCPRHSDYFRQCDFAGLEEIRKAKKSAYLTAFAINHSMKNPRNHHESGDSYCQR